MKIGIVGPEDAKFTPKAKAEAYRRITEILSADDVEAVVSGHCPLGGIDIYAEEVADYLGVPKQIKAPRQQTWDAEYGYKQRNLDIARCSDKLYVFVLDKLPNGFKGMKFELCYHCGTKDHVKGGGCWTGKQAKKLGKEVEWILIKNEE
jgi:hypothetical protein